MHKVAPAAVACLAVEIAEIVGLDGSAGSKGRPLPALPSAATGGAHLYKVEMVIVVAARELERDCSLKYASKLVVVVVSC